MSNNSSQMNLALEALRMKLLDLTGRNKLINFKYTAGKSLQFVEGHPASLYQRLVEENQKNGVSILGLPEPARDEWQVVNGRLQRPAVDEWAKRQNISTNYEIPGLGEAPGKAGLRALFYPDDLAKHCRTLERGAALAIEETGANMLFLVLGFLSFPEQPNGDKIFTAPLIGIPVSLKRRDINGVQNFSVFYSGDEITENISLREKLKNTFGLSIPGFSEDSLDVNSYFKKIESIIKKFPQFSLKHRTSLCLLSFNNMLLFRDLDPNTWPEADYGNSLVDHPLVRGVIEGSLVQGGQSSDFIQAEEHPVEEGPGSEIPLVYDADSSQHSALIDVLSLKRNLVIEGPPGTGKSQTITNLIAACLAEGKKVLFVSEKLAALQVVKSRLLGAGLDPFVLELHSSKVDKKEVINSISKRAAFNPKDVRDLPRLQQQLEEQRGNLKAYTDLINSVFCNSLGLTLHQIMWRAEKHRLGLVDSDARLGKVTVEDAEKISALELSRRMECLRHLGDQYISIGGYRSESAFWGFMPEGLVPGDELAIKASFEKMAVLGGALSNASTHLSEMLDGAIFGLPLDSCREQIDVIEKLLENSRGDLPFQVLPKFFPDGNLQVKAINKFKEFSEWVEKFHFHEGEVEKSLNSADGLTREVISRLEGLRVAGDEVGVSLGSVDELESLRKRISGYCERLSSAHGSAKDFFARKEIPYTGSRSELDNLLKFADDVLSAPEGDFYLQSAFLHRAGAIAAIDGLNNIKLKLNRVEESLGEYLYMDALPEELEIKRAVSTLREGDAWYRIFQGDWRRSVALHKSLQRTKEKVSSDRRLRDLENILELLDLKRQWESSSVWEQFIGSNRSREVENLSAYLRLAHWNSAIRMSFENIRAFPFDPLCLTDDSFRSLRLDFSQLRDDIAEAVSACDGIYGEMKRLPDVAGGKIIETVIEKTKELERVIGHSLEWLRTEAKGGVNLTDVIAGCRAALARFVLKNKIESNSEVKALLGQAFRGVDTDCAEIYTALSFGHGVAELNLLPQVKVKLRGDRPIAFARDLLGVLKDVYDGLSSIKSLTGELEKFGDFNFTKWTGSSLDEDFLEFSRNLHASADRASREIESVIPWSLYIARRKEACEASLRRFVALLEEGQLTPGELPDAYGYCVFSSIVREAFRRKPELSLFTGLRHDKIRDEFKRLDREIIGLRGKAIAYGCARNAHPPAGRNGARVDDRTEMTLLNHLFPQQRPRMPVRKILKRAGAAVQALKPCFMMGPQAVAQYLTPGAIKFDLVIMDEASQLKPEDAIGSIARGAQLVVVGDPKQLPPTNFFSQATQANDGADGAFTTVEAESILDICASQFNPVRTLRWHYRSRHHSLIAFSNHHFYGGNLVIFPSPYAQGGGLGVRAIYLPDAIYENQTNLREAKRVVDAVLEHIATRPDESLGIATLNVKQRDLITVLLEERLKSISGANDYCQSWAAAGQPLFIKNLENVQGDERDAIIVSTTFGKPPGSNSVGQNFGPISRQDGWRRLNVLFTRAKKSILVCTSLKPEDIVMDGATPAGTKALRNYLEYIRTGSLVVAEETDREPDSDFEVSVITMLKQHGYEVEPQLGVAGYRIDIAVKHPDVRGSYLAAIECDGTTYHSALSVRDRDRIRQEIIESLGWRDRIWRIWSTDWFRSPRQEFAKLLSFLEGLRKNWGSVGVSGETWIQESSMSEVHSSDQSAAETQGDSEESYLDRESIKSLLIEDPEDLEVQVGDVVRYVDVTKPEDILTVQLTRGKDDISNGIVNESRPLAQILLGAVIDDEVVLHLVGNPSKTYRVKEIRRAQMGGGNGPAL